MLIYRQAKSSRFKGLTASMHDGKSFKDNSPPFSDAPDFYNLIRNVGENIEVVVRVRVTTRATMDSPVAVLTIRCDGAPQEQAHCLHGFSFLNGLSLANSNIQMGLQLQARLVLGDYQLFWASGWHQRS